MELSRWFWYRFVYLCTECPTRYRNRPFFNNRLAGWRAAAPCRNN